MTTAVLTDRFPSKATPFADSALGGAARLWFLTAVAGQLLFAFSVASLYMSLALRGSLPAWNRFIHQAYVPGQPLGNAAVAAHLAAAVVIVLSGALQLVPQIRRRAPALHRWNGRLYLASAFVVSGAGVYMLWARSPIDDLSQKLGASLNAVLVMVFAALALRTAIARDFQTHRRWSLRLYLAGGGVWFFRVGFALSLLLNRGPFGFDPKTFRGPFLTFMAFACYLVPLAVLELYFLAQERPSAAGRVAMAAGLLVLTVAMGLGIFTAAMAIWVPRVKAAYDGRKSIDQTLSATIEASGVEAAVHQYRQLKATEPATYNFDERELNGLGYRLLRAGKIQQAIRIFELNVEAYPKSSNVYDSLAEGQLHAGQTAQAIANYRKALELNPANSGAAEALRKLGAS
jgi:hypothetical protein